MAILLVLFSLFGVLVIVTGKNAGGRLIGVMILLLSPRAKRRATTFGLGAIAVGTIGMLAIIGGSAFLVAGAVVLCLVAVWSLIAMPHRQSLALTPPRRRGYAGQRGRVAA